MPHYIIPSLQAVTQVGATTDQDTTFLDDTTVFFRDSALYIHSPSDGILRINADVQQARYVTAATSTGTVLSVTGSGGGRLGEAITSAYTTISGGSATGAQGLSVTAQWSSSDSSSSAIYGLSASPIVQGGTHSSLYGLTFGGTFAAVYSAITATDFRAINVPSAGFSPGAGCTVTDYHSLYVSAAAPVSTNTVTNYYGARFITPGAYTGTLTNATHLEIQDLGSYGGTSNKELFITGAGEAFFRDANTRIGSSTSGQLDLTAATTVKINTAQLVLPNFSFPLADGSANQVLQTDGAGTVSWATVSGGGGTPGGSNTQIQYNNAGAFGGTSAFTWDGSNLDLTSGDFRLDDNVDLVFGTGNDAKMYYDGTDLVINPKLVGSGVVKLGASSNAHLQCDKIGLGTTAYSANNVVNYNQSGGSRIVLNFQLDFTGSFTNPATIFAETIYSGTGATSSPTNIFSVKQNTQKSGTFSPVIGRCGFQTGFGLTTAVTDDFNCLTADWSGNGTGHTNGTLRRRGFICSGWGTPTGVASVTDWGGFTDKDWCLADNVKLYFEGSVNAKGDTYMQYRSGGSALETTVNGTTILSCTNATCTVVDAYDFAFGTTTGTKLGTGTTQKIGVYGATPIVQRSGAAQAAVATTAATNVAPYGYTTAAQADAIVTLVNELRAWAVAQGFIKGSA